MDQRVESHELGCSPMSSDQAKRRIGLRAKEGRYANFFRIGHNEFEFLIEFGQQDHGIHTRIYVSPQYARVLSDLLIESLQENEHEAAARRGGPR
jgi:Protein of unknown function (DUF3467)